MTDGPANIHSDNARAPSALLDSGVPFIGVGFGSEADLRTLTLQRAIAPPAVPPSEEFSISAQLEMSSAVDLPPFDLLLMRDGRLVRKKTVAAGKG